MYTHKNNRVATDRTKLILPLLRIYNWHDHAAIFMLSRSIHQDQILDLFVGAGGRRVLSFS